MPHLAAGLADPTQLNRRGFLALGLGLVASVTACASPYNRNTQAKSANNHRPVDQEPFILNSVEKSNYDAARNVEQMAIRKILISMGEDASKGQAPGVFYKRSQEKDAGQVIAISGYDANAIRARRSSTVTDIQKRVTITEYGEMTAAVGKFQVVDPQDFKSDILTDGVLYEAMLDLSPGPNQNPVAPIFNGTQKPWEGALIMAVDSPNTFAMIEMERFDDGSSTASIAADPNSVILDPAYVAMYDYTKFIANDGIAYGDQHAWLIVGTANYPAQRLEAYDLPTQTVFEQELPFFSDPLGYAKMVA